jgi:hypothetical protein
MDEWTPGPQEQGWLEPPRRRPPTAVGVATPPPPRRPRRPHYRETRMQRVGRVFAQLAVSTACGLAVGTFVSLPILVSLLAGLTGGRLILHRRRTPFSRLVLKLGSSSSRRAA